MRTAYSRTDRYADHLANLATVPIVQRIIEREEREKESRREVSRLEEDGMVFESAINNNWTRIKI